MRTLVERIFERFGYYRTSSLQVGAHCGLCGKWIDKVIAPRHWPWTACEKCQNRKPEECKPCHRCEHVKLGVPVAHCTHPKGHYEPLPDQYFLEHRPHDCPMSKGDEINNGTHDQV